VVGAVMLLLTPALTVICPIVAVLEVSLLVRTIVQPVQLKLPCS